MKKYFFLMALLALPALAFASSNYPAGDFDEFYKTINAWATGPLGVGLAVTMLLMGAAMGVAKNSPMPALTGVAGASFLHFGPAVISALMVGQGDVQATQTAQMPAAAQVASATAAASSVKAASTLVASATSAASATKMAATPASSTLVASAPQAAMAASTANGAHKYLAEAPELASLTPASPDEIASNRLKDSISKSVSHTPALPHTVPVPQAGHLTQHPLNPKAVSSSDLTKWLGIGGSIVILSLLGLLAYLSSHRKTKNQTGFTPNQPSAAPSAFTDPHGFQREKRSPGFNP